MTGAALTYGSAAEETIVLDISGTAAFPISGLGYKGGLSLIIDFDEGLTELYTHGGGVYGVGFGPSCGVGGVKNYNGAGTYGEVF